MYIPAIEETADVVTWLSTAAGHRWQTVTFGRHCAGGIEYEFEEYMFGLASLKPVNGHIVKGDCFRWKPPMEIVG
jgi:hypothetical protein